MNVYPDKHKHKHAIIYTVSMVSEFKEIEQKEFMSIKY